jgi:hypothetical protein
MNSDESSRNQDSPEITHSIPPRLPIKRRSMSYIEAKLFPLPKQEPTPFEKQRALIGLFKQGLETQQEFARRIVEAYREYQEKKAVKRSRSRKAS